MLDGHTANNQPGHARFQVGFDCLARANATTNLAGNTRSLNHRCNQIPLNGGSIFGTFQIDNVQPPAPGRGELANRVDGILAKDCFPVIVPLLQPDAAATP